MAYDHVPHHIAIVMDGNGRWANRRFLPRIAGHRQGVESLKRCAKACDARGIRVLTVFAFSSENWTRPQDEVSGLMSLFVEVLQREVKSLNELNVRVKVIGDLDSVPEATGVAFKRCVSDTSANTGLTLVVAINYGARQDITAACAQIASSLAAGRIDAEDITPALVGDHLSTAGIPDPDVVIRTSGECRLSNFLLFEGAYSELVVSDVLWPDFDRESFLTSILEYQGRDRRFGGL